MSNVLSIERFSSRPCCKKFSSKAFANANFLLSLSLNASSPTIATNPLKSLPSAYKANIWSATLGWSSRVFPFPIPSFISLDNEGNTSIDG